MADTLRTLTALLALLTDNDNGAIDFQDIRDIPYSVLGVSPYVAKTTAYTAAESDEVIACDATAAAFSITLPAVATTRVGKRYTVKKTDVSGNAVTVDGNLSETIDGATTFVLSAQWAVVTLINTGTAWLNISEYA